MSSALFLLPAAHLPVVKYNTHGDKIKVFDDTRIQDYIQHLAPCLFLIQLLQTNETLESLKVKYSKHELHLYFSVNYYKIIITSILFHVATNPFRMSCKLCKYCFVCLVCKPFCKIAHLAIQNSTESPKIFLFYKVFIYY